MRVNLVTEYFDEFDEIILYGTSTVNRFIIILVLLIFFVHYLQNIQNDLMLTNKVVVVY